MQPASNKRDTGEGLHGAARFKFKVQKFMKALRGAQKINKTKTNRMIHNRQSKLLKKFPELVHKKDVHVHKERKQLICRVEVEANFSMVCT